MSTTDVLMKTHTNYRIKTAERQYVEAFEDEIRAFKSRVKARAKEKVEAAIKEADEVGHQGKGWERESSDLEPQPPSKAMDCLNLITSTPTTGCRDIFRI